MQDRGLKPRTVFHRLLLVKTFFYFHIDGGKVDPDVVKRKLQIRLPQTLPRAIDPEDIREFLAVIDTIRDRAMILTLLRTGMRIGELLNLQMRELNLNERRIEIYQAHKDLEGRVVYLSGDAQRALRRWIKIRTKGSIYLYLRPERGAVKL